MDLPKTISDDQHLEQMLSEPSEAAIRALQQIEGDVLLLGAGGKMGPSLATMVRRASDAGGVRRKVIAVSRFSDARLPAALHAVDVETISGDLLDEDFVAELPDVANVIFMTGAKFGTSQRAAQTWAMNVLLPARICARFRGSRIMGFSTGNVYPLVHKDSGGSVESDMLDPVGEYAMSALGRERMFEYGSQRYAIPMAIVRLNYAVELRYGVVVDLAQKVLLEQEIDLSMGYANVIWQADANAMALAAMADAATPPFIINVAGPELLDVHRVCETLAELLRKPARFVGEPADTALLNNGSLGHARYGRPRVSLEQIVRWTAEWLERGGTTWQKPTHFEVRSGHF